MRVKKKAFFLADSPFSRLFCLIEARTPRRSTAQTQDHPATFVWHYNDVRLLMQPEIIGELSQLPAENMCKYSIL